MIIYEMNFLQLFNRTGLIAAHRGANSVCPENTMSALKRSVGHCDFMEIDVQLSSDGVAIVMHDDTLSRTTNVTKIVSFANKKPYRVCDFTFDELKTLDYGSWFYKDGSSHYEPLLTFSDTLKFIKENQLFLNVEIKDMHDSFSDEKVLSVILQEIENCGVQSQIIISSFRHEYLPLCKKRLPNVPTAALVEDKHPYGLIAYLKALEVDAYNFNDEIVDKQTVEKLRQAGFFVNIYTVNDPLRAKELFDIGVNGVFSDVLDYRQN